MSLGCGASCWYPRSCSNCAGACFHILLIPSALLPAGILVVVQTALTLVFTYSDSSPGDATPLKWDVVTNVGNGDFFTWG